MRTWLVSAALMVGTSAPLLACGEMDSDTAGSQVAQPIIDGTLDSSLDSVVFVVGAGGASGCSGTLFQVDRARDLAYVLTAAHCLDGGSPEGVMFGPDYADINSVFVRVTAAYPDPRYSPQDSTHDFAVLTLQGLPDTLPAPLPLTGASDGLSNGASVTSYGYGTTHRYQNPTDDNSKRYRIAKNIARLSSTLIEYNQRSGGGVCAGDSGGPVVSGSGSNAKVVGVHSSVGDGYTGGDPCRVQGNSSRLSSGLDFVQAALDEPPPPPVSACERCSNNAEAGDTVCRRKRDACLADSDCRSLYSCLQQAQTQSQANACLNTSSPAKGQLLAYLACPCVDQCASECSSDASCNGVPRCGYVGTGSQQSCSDANCCDEMAAASADKKGYECLTSASATGCGSSAVYQAAESCLATKCGSTQGSSSGNAGNGDGGSSGAVDGDGDGEEDGDRRRGSGEESGCAVQTPGQGAHTGSLLGALGLAGVVGLLRRRRPGA